MCNVIVSILTILFHTLRSPLTICHHFPILGLGNFNTKLFRVVLFLWFWLLFFCLFVLGSTAHARLPLSFSSFYSFFLCHCLFRLSFLCYFFWRDVSQPTPASMAEILCLLTVSKSSPSESLPPLFLVILLTVFARHWIFKSSLFGGGCILLA